MSRMGTSLLTTLGHPEWIATTVEEYVQIAATLAADLARLAHIRAQLRPKMQLSPLCDAAGYTADLEKLYLEMMVARSITSDHADVGDKQAIPLKEVMSQLSDRKGLSQPLLLHETSELAKQYIDLLKKSLLNELFIENELKILHTFQCMLNGLPMEYGQFFKIKQSQPQLFRTLLSAKETGATILLINRSDPESPIPAHSLRNVTELSHTMIGRKRLENIQYCVETILQDGIEGDFMETGIWRGGACIFMRGILKAYGVTDRIIWAADSFEGVPVPSLHEDAGFDISRNHMPVLAVSLEEVRELFARYDLLDDRVRFLKGWFKETLPTAPIEQLAILRLDGDLYESTMDALVPLYDKVTMGGFVIVDDYGSCPPCRRAIHDFRAQRGIHDPLIPIDVQSVYWRKG